MASLTPIRELRRKADGEPRQEDLFHERFIVPEYWAYVLFVRTVWIVADPMLEGEWSEWVPCWEKPNHFRSEASAVKALFAFREKEKRKHALGLLESKVEPKYIGCVPDKDEKWIAD